MKRFELKAWERAALSKAERRLAKWKSLQATFPDPVPRPIFNALESAANGLRKALKPFWPQDSMARLQLLNAMQDQAMNCKEEYAEALEGLDTALGMLATAAATCGGNGTEGTHETHVWVRIAADEWRKRELLEGCRDRREPAIQGGRFYHGLQALKVGKPRLPTLTKDIVKTQVREWRRLRVS